MKDHASCLFKDIRITKASWRLQPKTHKLKLVLVFIVDYESCFFLLVATFLIVTFPILLLFFICIHVYELNMFPQMFLYVGF